MHGTVPAGVGKSCLFFPKAMSSGFPTVSPAYDARGCDEGNHRVGWAGLSKLVKRKKKCHFIVCNTTKLVPLLFIQFTLLVEKMEEIEKQYIQISLVENLGSCLNVDLKVLWKKIAQYPNHFTFVDEFVVNLKNNRTEMEVKNGIINDIKTLTKVNKVFCLLDFHFSTLDNII